MTEKEQKDKLEEYAYARFNVNLDKRKSLSSLQAQVEALEAAEDAQDNASVIVESGAESVRTVAMNEHARRIWDGQMPSLPIRERVARIVRGLQKQGYTDMSGLLLPTKEDYKRYL